MSNKNNIFSLVYSLLIIGIIVFSILVIKAHFTVMTSSKIDLQSDPVQAATNVPPFEFERKGEKGIITPLFNYKVCARVVGTERYYFDKEADISPLDIGLAWGNLPGDKRIRFSQSTRWLYYRYDDPSVDPNYVNTHAANTHIIPANERVEDAVLKIRIGDDIVLEGYLISYKSSNNNWFWNSSTSRDDTGNGACEVMYVTKAQRGDLAPAF